jgi:HEAT repeat protein
MPTNAPVSLRSRIVLVLLITAGAASQAAAQARPFLNKSLGQWTKELSHGTGPERRSAAFALGKLGADAAAAVPRLVLALDDADPTVVDAAAFALGEIGPAARDAVPSLVTILADPKADPRVRRSAAFAIGGVKADSSFAVEALVRALAAGDPGLRQNAAWALGRLSPPNPKPVVQALQDSAGDPDALVRRDVAAALGSIGKEARPALSALTARLPQESDPEVRKAILSTLVNLVGPDDGSAAPPLRTCLKDPDPETSRLAAFALGNLGGSQAVPALPILRSALADPVLGVRRQAAAALANIGPEAAPAVPELCSALADGDAQVQSRSAIALAAIGPPAKDAVPHVTRLLRSKTPEVRQYATEALARIATELEPAIDDLKRLLTEDPEILVRQRAVWVLGRVPNLESSGAAAALESVLSDKDPETALVRYEAARYLAHGLRDRTPDKAIDILVVMLGDTSIKIYTRTDAKVQSGAESGGSTSIAPKIGGDGRTLPAQALGLIGPKANRPDVVRALDELTRAADPRLRGAAKDALGKIKK